MLMVGSKGTFTYCSALGTSVVDYAITDMDPSYISAFTVRPQTPLTDHCQINVYLKRIIEQIAESEPCKLYRLQVISIGS
uniref:Endonuclease/exonuclease/phosphatase domain-containing protein n=1 Tax=Anguilla anguilla TaxID=7936 RepID=A0A0E9WKT0_ANGAN